MLLGNSLKKHFTLQGKFSLISSSVLSVCEVVMWLKNGVHFGRPKEKGKGKRKKAKVVSAFYKDIRLGRSNLPLHNLV